MLSKLRPEVAQADPNQYCPRDGTAYLMIFNAVESKEQLVHGKLHAHGESCAIGSFWDVNAKCALPATLIDEVAAVNDSVPDKSPRQRRLVVLRWLRWKLATLGMPGFYSAAKQLSAGRGRSQRRVPGTRSTRA